MVMEFKLSSTVTSTPEIISMENPTATESIDGKMGLPIRATLLTDSETGKEPGSIKLVMCTRVFSRTIKKMAKESTNGPTTICTVASLLTI